MAWMWRRSAGRHGNDPHGSPASEHAPGPAEGALTEAHVAWAYRLLLDREAESPAALSAKLAGCRTTEQLRREIMTSAEFREKNPDYAHANDPTVVIKMLGDGSRLFIDLSDHVIGLGILRDRYETDAVRFIGRTLRRGQHALDVGAHIGFFTVHMAGCVGPGGSVRAFEPFEANARLLERSIVENGFQSFVTLQRAAVGARASMARLAFARETLNSGGAFLLSPDAEVPDQLVSAAVSVVALDELELTRPVSFVKLDVEGAEPLVVEGARRLLSTDRPVILSELHGVQLARVAGSSARDLVRQLEELGYTCHELAAEGAGAPINTDALPPVCSAVFLPR